MLQLKNKTPFAPAITVFPNAQGIDTLYVVIKATFSLKPTFAVSETQVPVTAVDEYSGDPAASSLTQASELHLGKPGTDVILKGNAWAPEGRTVTQMQVSLSAANRRIVAYVFGDRRWQANGCSAPEPFEAMPLVFERAFGGSHRPSEDARLLAEERNPVGAGFRGKRSAYDMIGRPLPNIEHPGQPITRIDDNPTPVAFGFVAPSWQPRRAHAGTYDEHWQKRRAPYLPQDFNARFFHVAPPDLCFEQPFTGGEPIEVIGASRGAPIRFHIPFGAPRAAATIAGAEEAPPCQLETVLIEPDANRVSLTYRAALPCDKRVLKIEQVAVETGSLQLSPAARA